ncbi:MAG TPA: TetR family transcriptional regulator C-terminal domain-containing protein, partial [Desulfobacterales bacterium]|nr:TetR family transcriptional regulator C-terminal domain-containing protein [Desulfobacterales bacterium]
LLDQIMGLSRQSLDTLAGIFEEGVEAGSLLDRDPQKVALILWSLFSGLVLWEESKRALDPRKDFLMPTLDMAFEIFGRGIAKRNTD